MAGSSIWNHGGMFFSTVGGIVANSLPHHALNLVSCLFTAGAERLLKGSLWDRPYQLPITRWPCQSRAPVGAAPPTRSQLRLQRQTQVPVQAQTIGCHQPRPSKHAPSIMLPSMGQQHSMKVFKYLKCLRKIVTRDCLEKGQMGCGNLGCTRSMIVIQQLDC